MDLRADRRSRPRVAFSSVVEVVHGDRHLPCCPAFDLSEGGVRLAANLPNASRVNMLIALTHDEQEHVSLVKGQVAWRKLNSAGIRFVGLSAETESLIRQYVLAHTQVPLTTASRRREHDQSVC